MDGGNHVLNFVIVAQLAESFSLIAQCITSPLLIKSILTTQPPPELATLVPSAWRDGTLHAILPVDVWLSVYICTGSHGAHIIYK